MINILGAIFHISKVFYNLHFIKLDKDIKNKILKSYIRAIILKQIDTANRSANITGYRLNYLHKKSFVHLFHEIFLDQEYYFTTLNKSPLIIDCGSNIGMSILYFKLIYPNARIIGFEPSDDAFTCLEKNITDNNIQHVEVHKRAVSDHEGKIDFYYDIENPGSLVMSTIRDRMPKQNKSVDAVRLSNYINEEVEFLKIDVEGAELDVIQELYKSGKLNYIKQIAIEYHHHIVRGKDVMSGMLQILEEANFGYQISSNLARPFSQHEFQDILIYAYNKNLA